MKNNKKERESNNCFRSPSNNPMKIKRERERALTLWGNHQVIPRKIIREREGNNSLRLPSSNSMKNNHRERESDNSLR